MNKFTSIVLSILFLGQSFQISATDMLQLDDLFNHTVEHYQQTGDSIYKFVSLHYGNLKFEHSKEHSQHKNLPFQQKLDVSISSVFYIQECLQKSINLTPIADLKSQFYYLEFQSFFEIRSLFQPPKSK